jgi:hypothetical protein
MPTFQLGFYLFEGKAARGEQDEGVIEQVGSFGDDALIALPLDGQNHFYGFFTNFFDDLIFAHFEKLGGVRRVGGISLAVLDDGLEGMEKGHFL